jgi:type II secretion system (T2SS) protein C
MIAPARRLSLLLLLGIGACAAASGWTLMKPAPSAGTAAPAAAKAAAPPVERALGPLVEFGETAARPLFAESRRPAAAPAAAPPRKATLRLEGVIAIGATKHALLRDNGGNRRFRVGEGDEVAGWTVRRIERDRVVLASPDGEITLETGHPAE